jgi:hypothetical protein
LAGSARGVHSDRGYATGPRGRSLAGKDTHSPAQKSLAVKLDRRGLSCRSIRAGPGSTHQRQIRSWPSLCRPLERSATWLSPGPHHLWSTRSGPPRRNVAIVAIEERILVYRGLGVVLGQGPEGPQGHCEEGNGLRWIRRPTAPHPSGLIDESARRRLGILRFPMTQLP